MYQRPNSRLAGYIDIRIGQETINWARSIKPNDYERAVMVNTVLDLYHAANIYDLTRLTTEIDRKSKPKVKGITINTLTARVTEGYNQAKFKESADEKQSPQAIIRKLILDYRVANSLGETRFDFSRQMETFGNYCNRIFNELIMTNKEGRRVELEVASSEYL